MTPPPCQRHSRRQDARDGFVLVNALVLVAALAAVAALLLSRAEQGRGQLEAGLLADQLDLGLDAFDALALTDLARDHGATDHLREAWASPRQELALEPGSVSGQLQDQQGRYNVNWLSNPADLLAEQAFLNLLQQRGLPADIAPMIRSFVTPSGLSAQQRARWQRRQPAQDPVGGPLLHADQLADLPGLSPRAYARLRPLITALPGDSRLNVNTALPEVLAAFLPHLPPAARAKLIRSRDQTPFPSVKAFLVAAQLERILPQDNGSETSPEGDPEVETDPLHLLPERLSVNSSWFLLRSQSRLERYFAHRETLFRRRAPGRRPDLIWRITRRP